jgi:hypothetical protein
VLGTTSTSTSLSRSSADHRRAVGRLRGESRQPIALADGVSVQLPAIADLILTKRFAPRPKDLEDIRLLEILQQEGDTP